MLRVQTLIMFLVVIGVTSGTIFTLNTLVDRSDQVNLTTGATAEEVFGSSVPAKLSAKSAEMEKTSSAEAEVRRIARAVAVAAAQQAAVDVARQEVADQL